MYGKKPKSQSQSPVSHPTEIFWLLPKYSDGPQRQLNNNNLKQYSIQHDGEDGSIYDWLNQKKSLIADTELWDANKLIDYSQRVFDQKLDVAIEAIFLTTSFISLNIQKFLMQPHKTRRMLLLPKLEHAFQMGASQSSQITWSKN